LDRGFFIQPVLRTARPLWRECARLTDGTCSLSVLSCLQSYVAETTNRRCVTILSVFCNSICILSMPGIRTVSALLLLRCVQVRETHELYKKCCRRGNRAGLEPSVLFRQRDVASCGLHIKRRPRQRVLQRMLLGWLSHTTTLRVTLSRSRRSLPSSRACIWPQP
jgi:hypothetical protein